MWRKKTHTKNVYLVFDLIWFWWWLLLLIFVSYLPSFTFSNSWTLRHTVLSLSLFLFLFHVSIFFYSLHICWTALCWMRARVHTHTFIHKHSSYTNIFRLLLLLLLLLCCCCFVVPKLTMNVKCRNLLIFLLVCAHSLSLARSFSIYLWIYLFRFLNNSFALTHTFYLAHDVMVGFAVATYACFDHSGAC